MANICKVCHKCLQKRTNERNYLESRISSNSKGLEFSVNLSYLLVFIELAGSLWRISSKPQLSVHVLFICTSLHKVHCMQSGPRLWDLPNLHFLWIRNFEYLANFWGGFDFYTSHLESSSLWKNFQEHAVREPPSKVASGKVQHWIVMFQIWKHIVGDSPWP